MSPTPSSRVALVALAGTLAALGACSFTTATGFDECGSDQDCAASSACSHHYCLPMPATCQRSDGVFDAGDRIPLAALLPLTTSDGGTAQREVYRLAAMRLAITEANKTGLKGRPFALFVCDHAGSDGLAAAQTSWLVKNLEVPAIIVSGSGPLLAAEQNDDRARAGTFMMSYNATAVSFVSEFQTKGNIWRIAPPDTLQAQVVLGLLSTDAGSAPSDAGPDAGAPVDAGPPSLFLLADRSTYGASFEFELASRAAALGYPANQRDFDAGLLPSDAVALAGAVSNQRPNVTILVALPPEVQAIATAAASLPRLQPASGHRWLLTDSAKDPSIITPVTAPVLEGAVGTAPAQGSGPAYVDFTSTYKSRVGIDPNSYSFIAHASDAMWVTLAAAAWATRDGGITGPRMGEAIAHMLGGTSEPLVGAKWVDLSGYLSSGRDVNVEGASGTLQFDLDAGAPSSPYEIWGVVDGGIVSKGYITP